MTLLINSNELYNQLFPYAYNILGTYQDSEDVIQDLLLKWQTLDKRNISNEKNYLIKSVINRSINLKKKRQKEDYFGTWLPEPIDMEDYKTSDMEQTLSYSVLIVLEKLTPKERAILLLKELFNNSHSEISQFLDITEENSRKIYSRTKKKVTLTNTSEIEPLKENATIEKFLDVVRSGNEEILKEILLDDIFVQSDGGGKVAAFINTISGIEPCVKLLIGLQKKFYSEYNIKVLKLNNTPAIVYTHDQDILLCQVFILNFVGKIRAIHHIRNPEKLTFLKKYYL